MSTMYVNQIAPLQGDTISVASGKILDVSSGSFIPSAGQIVQQQITRDNTRTSTTSVNTWVELSSAYRVSITPKYADSIIRLDYHIPINPQGAANILMAIAPWRSTNGGSTQTLLAQGNTASIGSRHNLAVSWFRSNNGYDTNDMQNHVVIATETAGTTSTLTYGWQYRAEGTNTLNVCYSATDSGTWGWVAPVTLIATEIKQ